VNVKEIMPRNGWKGSVGAAELVKIYYKCRDTETGREQKGLDAAGHDVYN
jgi:hypothetical protein